MCDGAMRWSKGFLCSFYMFPSMCEAKYHARSGLQPFLLREIHLRPLDFPNIVRLFFTNTIIQHTEMMSTITRLMSRLRRDLMGNNTRRRAVPLNRSLLFKREDVAMNGTRLRLTEPATATRPHMK